MIRIILISAALFLAIPPALAANNPKTQTTFCERLILGFKRLTYMPKALLEIRKLVKEEFTTEKMDENLHAFWGFHQRPTVRGYQQRPWNKVKVDEVSPDQIIGMPSQKMIDALQYAMEIEDPIMSYSEQSGKGFRYLLPNMGRFMGRNEEQMAHYRAEKAKGSKDASVCEAGWCSEEHRHGTMWARTLRALTGIDPSRENAATPTITSNTEKGARAHLDDRQGTEWGASSSYLFMASHSKHALREVLLNVMRDEIKHLVIMSSADVYLYGYRPNFRSARIVKKIVRDFVEGLTARSAGKSISSDPFVIAEVIATHVMIEVEMRRYLRTLPLSTLTKIFDSESQLEGLVAIEIEADRKAANLALETLGKEKRTSLSLWKSKQRDLELAQRAFEEENRAAIDLIVQKEFANFWELSESLRSFNDFLYKIQGSDYYEIYIPLLKKHEKPLLKAALVDRLFDFRIMNNAGSKRIEETAAEKAARKLKNSK